MKTCAAIAFLVVAASSPTAMGQPISSMTGCVPPLEPYPFDPPRDDPELMTLVNEEYQVFLREAEDYINCLAEERERAFQLTNDVLARYLELFGDQAAIRSTVDSSDQ